MTGQRITLKSGWQLLILAGAAQWAIGCGSSSNTPRVDAGAGGSDGGSSDSGAGGKLSGAGGRGTGGTGGVVNPACASPLYPTTVSAFGAIFDNWDVASVSSDGLGPVTTDGGMGTLRELDTTQGDPTNGSVKLTIPFTMPGQTMLFARLYGNGVNLSGATVTARVKLDPGGVISGPTDSALAFIIFKSGAAYVYAEGQQKVVLDPSLGWMTVTASASNPGPGLSPDYSPCEVREIDVAIQTGTTGNYRTGVVHIDTISVANAAADAGSDADDAASDSAAAETGGDVPASTPDTATSPDTATTPDASDASSGG